jgi:hypothetical protein
LQVWYPSGDESLPRAAEECILGTTGVYAVTAGAIFFGCLILVCLKAPEKRKLKPNYGQEVNGDEDDVEHAMEYGQSDRNFDDRGSTGSYETDRRFSFSHSRGTSRGDAPARTSPGYGSYGEDGFHEGESQTSRPKFLDDDDLVSERLKNLDPEEDKYTAKPIDDRDTESTEDRYNPKKPAAMSPVPSNPEQTVSKSRLHARERMELNSAAESDDLIQKFVNDLNISFLVDNATKEKKDEKPVEKPGFFQNLCATPSDQIF